MLSTYLESLPYLLCILVIAPDARFGNLNVQTDNEPLRIVKPADQNVHYRQQINVRFLEPPPPPEPAPIIIKVRSLYFQSEKMMLI